MFKTFAIAFIVAGCAVWAHAETPAQVAHWSAELAPAKPTAGAKAEITLTAAIMQGWHLYSISQPPGGPIPTKISFPQGSAITLAGTVDAPAPKKAFDSSFGIDTETYTDSVAFKIPVQVASAGETAAANVNVRFQVCNDHLCLPPSIAHVAIPGFVAVAAGGTATSGVPANPSKDVVVPTTPPIQSQPLSSFLLFAMGMGALSLLTPCVFPMVPITVSYFSSHGSANRKGAVTQSVIYGLGIVLTFSAIGLALALIFGASGVNRLATNPWVNLLITGIFIGFAFSLFGAYLIQFLPA